MKKTTKLTATGARKLLTDIIAGVLILVCFVGWKVYGFLDEKKFRENLLSEIDVVVQEVSEAHGLSNVITQDYNIWSSWDEEDIEKYGYIKCDLYIECPQFHDLTFIELAEYSDDLGNKLSEKRLLSPENVPLHFRYAQTFMCPQYNKNGCMAYEHCSTYEMAYRPIFENVGEYEVYDLSGNRKESGNLDNANTLRPSSTPTGKCCICKKTASHTFQGSNYCDSCYNDAVKWAIDHPKK